jgi:hypothetical protein
MADSEVYFIYSDGTAVPEHAGSLVRPYQLVLATQVNHDDSDVSACSGEFSIPSCLAQDWPGKALRWRCWSYGIKLLSVYICHERPRSVSS